MEVEFHPDCVFPPCDIVEHYWTEPHEVDGETEYYVVCEHGIFSVGLKELEAEILAHKFNWVYTHALWDK